MATEIATLALLGVGLCAAASLAFVLAPTSGHKRARAESNALTVMAGGVVVLLIAALIQASVT